VLGHMLDGLEVDAAPVFGAGAIGPDQPRTVFEDRWLVVVDKPVGLLSVPGRAGLADSVQTRLQARHPEADGPLIVHRLDLDTSGLMVVAKDAATYHALQRQFFRREIDKRYVALLDGVVAAERGTVELALRVDLDDRPRQIHDPVHGKPALTEWSVLSREAAHTRVALYPRTGRTHQLRVHAAHPRGLAAPIVGDRLYGQPAERLMLHAEALAFVHPHTGQRLELVQPAPF
jgi:tRNA pseudouridine32 synthase/23S rRNA pseudouridine746 synthase